MSLWLIFIIILQTPLWQRASFSNEISFGPAMHLIPCNILIKSHSSLTIFTGLWFFAFPNSVNKITHGFPLTFQSYFLPLFSCSYSSSHTELLTAFLLHQASYYLMTFVLFTSLCQKHTYTKYLYLFPLPSSYFCSNVTSTEISLNIVYKVALSSKLSISSYCFIHFRVLTTSCLNYGYTYIIVVVVVVYFHR